MTESSFRAAIEKNYLSTSPVFNRMPSRARHPFYLQNYRAYFPVQLTAPVLDVGIGCGDLLLLWEELGYQNVWGVDISAEPVRVCSERFPSFHICKVEATSSFLRMHGGTYALITMFDVLEHLSKDEMFEILVAARDALRPAGRLVVQTPNAANLFQIAGRYCDVTHEQSFTEVSLNQIFSIAGFEHFEVGPVETCVPLNLKRRFKRLLRGMYHDILRLAYRLDDGNQFKVMTPLIRVVARKGDT
jgi:O-antigen chain-terminating methyltransferase